MLTVPRNATCQRCQWWPTWHDTWLTYPTAWCAGEDKKVALWQVDDWKVAAQSKPLPRGAAHTVLFTHHGAAACGEEPCLLLVRYRWDASPRLLRSGACSSLLSGTA